MRVFVTGASGFIGSAIVPELLAAGHQVLGLARSDASAAAVAAAGAEVHRGSLTDPDSLRAGATAADGVIHTAYVHGFTEISDLVTAAATDRVAIAALSEALAGTGKPLVITSGAAGMSPGGVSTELTAPAPGSFGELRFRAEELALSLAEQGVRPSVVRLPPTVHGKGDDRGFVARIIATAREKEVSAYPGGGENVWPAVHRLDAAHLYRLAVESAPAGTRLNGVAEQGVPVRLIAEAIGRNLGLPVESIPVERATEHFGFVGRLLTHDVPVSSELTRKLLDWVPAEPDLVDDLDAGHYFQ